MEEEVLRLRREKLGADHPDTLRAMQNLAISYSDTGRLEEALGIREEVLRLRREKLGADHPDTLSAMNNLASTLNAGGRLPDAVSFLRRCAAESPVIHAGVCYNLACYECLSGNLDEAKRLITEELASDPEKKERALSDEDLAAIHDHIASL
jgi:Flp pilus assembly protein TadD